MIIALSNRITSVLCLQADFLESVLGAGLLLYVSETWLSQVYRGVRHQDLLTVCGLPTKLIHGPIPSGDGDEAVRGACLVKMLVDFDGIGWAFNVSSSILLWQCKDIRHGVSIVIDTR